MALELHHRKGPPAHISHLDLPSHLFDDQRNNDASFSHIVAISQLIRFNIINNTIVEADDIMRRAIWVYIFTFTFAILSGVACKFYGRCWLTVFRTFSGCYVVLWWNGCWVCLVLARPITNLWNFLYCWWIFIGLPISPRRPEENFLFFL